MEKVPQPRSYARDLSWRNLAPLEVENAEDEGSRRSKRRRTKPFYREHPTQRDLRDEVKNLWDELDELSHHVDGELIMLKARMATLENKVELRMLD